MSMDYTAIILAISAAVLSGMGTAIIAGIRDNKKEKVRQQEREQDHLKMEALLKLSFIDKAIEEYHPVEGLD